MTAAPDEKQDVLSVTGTPEEPPASRMGGLRKAGHFEAAAAVARRELSEKPSTAEHLEAGTTLAAVSDYDAADAHLLLAGLDPAKAPAALAKLSEIAWIRHDHARGRDFALDGLELDPGARGCRIQLRRNEAAEAADNALGDTQGMLAHAAFHADPHGNAGDLALGDAVRRCFDLEYQPKPRKGLAKSTLRKQNFPRWWYVHVHQEFDEQRLARVNAGDGLVLGGGGLFLPDTAPNGNSGWQWNVNDEMLRRITVPLVVWAVGYNTFEGQSFDGSRFATSLRTLVERASFIGLRNSGSVERVRAMLPAELAARIHWQPCPTTVASRLGGPVWETPRQPGEGDSGPVLLNCAYDRSDRRFGDDYGRFLENLKDWILATRHRAEVQYAAHCVDDETFVLDLRREHGLSLPVIPMYDMTVTQIQETYRKAALVVGMRGHAGMVPFGCGTPIISLISHPKLGFFLADLERPDWGIPVHEPALAERLGELTEHILDDRAAVVADVDALQERLFEVTLENLAALPEPLRVVPRR
jgi:polysaccharide pyruvyl transferase WcaK-like protein